MSKPSSRCLILMTDSKLQKRVSSHSVNQTHHTISSFNHTSSNSFNLQLLNTSRRDFSNDYISRDSVIKPKKVESLKQTLKQKEEMSEFYRKQLKRRRNRFQEEVLEKEKVLNETITNLVNLIKIEVEKNRALQEQIEKHQGPPYSLSKNPEESDSEFTESRTSILHEETMLLQEAPTPFSRYF